MPVQRTQPLQDPVDTYNATGEFTTHFLSQRRRKLTKADEPRDTPAGWHTPSGGWTGNLAGPSGLDLFGGRDSGPTGFHPIDTQTRYKEPAAVRLPTVSTNQSNARMMRSRGMKQQHRTSFLNYGTTYMDERKAPARQSWVD